MYDLSSMIGWLLVSLVAVAGAIAISMIQNESRALVVGGLATAVFSIVLFLMQLT